MRNVRVEARKRRIRVKKRKKERFLALRKGDSLDCYISEFRNVSITICTVEGGRDDPKKKRSSKSAGAIRILSLWRVWIGQHLWCQNQNFASSCIELEIGVIIVENVLDASRAVLETHIVNIFKKADFRSVQRGRRIGIKWKEEGSESEEKRMRERGERGMKGWRGETNQ